MSAGEPLTLAVLVSGAGSNLQAIIGACASGALAARIVLVASDRPSAGGLERARAAGLPTAVVRPRDFASRAAADAALALACQGAGAQLVVLAGYMRLVGPAFLEHWQGRCINVHPSLLPSFPGLEAPAQALARGVRITGCTVHFVDGGADTGPIIAQACVPVHAGDSPQTLHERIQEAEWRLLPQAIGWIAAGRVHLRAGRVEID